MSAAERLVLEGSSADMTMDEVARAVGVSKPALYYHFPSKDALMTAVIRQALERDAQDIQKVLSGARTPAAQLRALVRVMLRADERPYQALHERLRDITRSLPSAQMAQLQPAFQAGLPSQLQSLLQAGIEAGEFRPHDTHLMAQMLGSVLGSLGGAGSTDHVEDEVMRFVWAGLTSNEFAAKLI
nr:TetR/AcrR family transcriptional regulator [Deinococcus sp. Arct2-2]